MKIMMSMLLGLALTQVAPLASADQSDSFGNYTIHYNTFTTYLLDPDIASRYGITQNKSQALIMVSVFRKVMGTTGQPVKAKVQITASDINGQRDVVIRELNEAGAIYYLGETPVNHQETVTLTVSWTPEGETSPYGETTPYHTTSFQSQYFTK